MNLRLSFSMEEIEELTEALAKHEEHKLATMIYKKQKKAFPTKEAHLKRTLAGVTSRKKVANKNFKKIEEFLELKKKDKNFTITVSSVAKELKLSYNTVNKYRDKVNFAEADRKRKFNIKKENK